MASGSEIYITFDRWKVYVVRKEMDLSFVNFMKDGADYLIFLSESIGYKMEQKYFNYPKIMLLPQYLAIQHMTM